MGKVPPEVKWRRESMANTRQTAQDPLEPTWPWEVDESTRLSVGVTKKHSAQDWRATRTRLRSDGQQL